MDLNQYGYVYNAAAHFAAQEKYPDGLWAELIKPGAAGFDALCWALAETSMQAELVRRDMGHDRRDALSEDKLRIHLKPRQINEARSIVLTAMTKGLSADDEADEVDEVMAEIQKKTGTD